jgi:hypothetical protein
VPGRRFSDGPAASRLPVDGGAPVDSRIVEAALECSVVAPGRLLRHRMRRVDAVRNAQQGRTSGPNQFGARAGAGGSWWSSPPSSASRSSPTAASAIQSSSPDVALLPRAAPLVYRRSNSRSLLREHFACDHANRRLIRFPKRLSTGATPREHFGKVVRRRLPRAIAVSAVVSSAVRPEL